MVLHAVPIATLGAGKGRALQKPGQEVAVGVGDCKQVAWSQCRVRPHGFSDQREHKSSSRNHIKFITGHCHTPGTQETQQTGAA